MKAPTRCGSAPCPLQRIGNRFEIPWQKFERWGKVWVGLRRTLDHAEVGCPRRDLRPARAAALGRQALRRVPAGICRRAVSAARSGGALGRLSGGVGLCRVGRVGAAGDTALDRARSLGLKPPAVVVLLQLLQHLARDLVAAHLALGGRRLLGDDMAAEPTRLELSLAGVARHGLLPRRRVEVLLRHLRRDYITKQLSLAPR